MKRMILLLVLIASAVFAATEKVDVKTECAKGCCKDYGTWDGSTCRAVSDQEAYAECNQICEQVASGSLSCCGGALILLVVPFLFLRKE